MKKGILCLLICVHSLFLFAQSALETEESCSPVMMDQEIKHTLEEHQRQKVMKRNETKNLALETSNQKQWTKIKKVVAKIQNRLSIVDFALQSIPTGVVMTRKVKTIKKNTKYILNEVKEFPPNLIQVVERELNFAKDVEMVSRLLIGIVASYGAINQMEKAERKILLDYALAEVERIESASYDTLYLIREAKRILALKRAEMNYYVNRDKELIKDILNELKSF